MKTIKQFIPNFFAALAAFISMNAVMLALAFLLPSSLILTKILALDIILLLLLSAFVGAYFTKTEKDINQFLLDVMLKFGLFYFGGILTCIILYATYISITTLI